MIKKIAKSVTKFFKDPGYRFTKLTMLGVYDSLSDEQHLKKYFYAVMGYELNLNNPKTFNEKLQWLKLYNRNPIYTTMVDKYNVKQYVTERIGDEYIIPTLGVWDNFADIDFDSLPNQFVLKCTHDSGGLVICKDKSSFDIQKARVKITKSLKHDFFMRSREWPYKNVKPRIIAEKYMEDSITSELRDYKFFCFDGVCRALFVATDRQTVDEETRFDFFDENYNHLNIINGHPNAIVKPKKPQKFELMKQLAEKLSAGVPHLRVDFYEVNGEVYFGELTFFHQGGFVPFEPKEWDEIFGSYIKLPNEKMEKIKD